MKLSNLFDFIYRIEVFGAILLIMIFTGIFIANQFGFLGSETGSQITGFVSFDDKVQYVDLEISESQTYILEADEEFIITSFSISGMVEGDGIARVFFEDSAGQTYLVYTNINEIESSNIITGFASFIISVDEKEETNTISKDDIGSDFITESGEFFKACQESCFMNVNTFPDQPNKVIFELSEGVIMKIDEISYTVSGGDEES